MFQTRKFFVARHPRRPVLKQQIQLTQPDSPRWLLEKDRPEDARKALQYLRGAEDHPEEIEAEMTEIKQNVELHKSITEVPWHILITDRDLLARLWRGALLQFMAQMCGATAIKYYLPTVFLALGLSKDLSLMASGIESTLKIGCTIIEMLIIDKLGRKKTLLLGCGIMSIAMIVSLRIPARSPISTKFWRIPELIEIAYRLTAPCRWPTQTTKTMPPIMRVLSSSFSSPSDIPLASDPTHGFMAQRYVLPVSPLAVRG